MPYPYFVEITLDDLLRSLYDDVLTEGQAVEPTKGATLERTGVLLELTNPRARLSRTETKGHAFTALGELFWYLSGTRDVDFITYYISDYARFAEGPLIWGGYGQRLFAWRDQDQIANVLKLLKDKPNSRRAAIQIFDAIDIASNHEDVPCTCALQFLNRNGSLELIVFMRSNDVFKGLPHDIFAFSMLQEIMARSLGLDVGPYKHAVGSLHLYVEDRGKVEAYLNEGWQSTKLTMPELPSGDPWPMIRRAQEAERAIRERGRLATEEIQELGAYWGDLVRLLLIFRYGKDHNIDAIRGIAETMASKIYQPYIQRQVALRGFEEF